MDWIAFAEFSLIGLLTGGLLALVALGFVLIYKGTRVINFLGLHRPQCVGLALVVIGAVWLTGNLIDSFGR